MLSSVKTVTMSQRKQVCLQEVMAMNIGPDELKRFQEAADINEIAMMLGRYVTLMDQFDAKSIYEELFAKDDPEVSVEYDTCGTYRGPENTRAFMVDYFHKNLSTITRDKHGWLDFGMPAHPTLWWQRTG